MTTSGQGQLTLTVTASKPTTTTQLYAISATDAFGNAVAANGISIVPATGWTNNENGTYTFTRGATDSSYTAQAAAPGYLSVTQDFVVPQQPGSNAPALAVSTSQSATQETIVYTVSVTLKYRLNGGSSTPAPASPWVVSRPAGGGADDTYDLTATGVNGATLGQRLIVDAQVTASGGAVPTTTATQTSPWGYSTAAQANDIVTLVNNMRTALIAKGILS